MNCNDIHPYDPIALEYGLGGDMNVSIQHYKNIVNQKYHPEHPDGGFVDKLEDAFAELELLDGKYSDHKKFQFLTHNMFLVGLTEWMQFVDKKDSFSKCKLPMVHSKDAQSI
jgi:hypothetical protein